MLIKKGYVIPSVDPLVIYKTTEDIKTAIEKQKLNIEFSAEYYKTKYYATYNDGEILVSPEDNVDTVLEKCNQIATALWDSEKKIVIDFENNDIAHFYDAFNYLENHPIFKGHFNKCLEVEVVRVNPATMKIEDNKILNTKTQVWLECGPFVDGEITHDIDLDCGDDTFEIAIVELAELVRKHYSDNESYALEKVNKKYK